MVIKMRKPKKMRFHEKQLAVMMDYYNPQTYDDLLKVFREWFTGIKNELKKRIKKDKTKMGADLAYYMDIREIFDLSCPKRTVMCWKECNSRFCIEDFGEK